MTNYSSSESQRLFPHTGLATSSFSRNASHSIQRSQQQHTPNEARSSHDNTTTGPSFLPRLETPVKRQKLDGGNPSSISASETPPHDIKASVFLGQIGRPLINKSRELSDLTQAGTLVSKEQHQIAPFPARPGNLSGKNVTIDEKLLADAPREPVQARPYAFEVPRIAPIYQNGNPADFFPWKGNHPEDILNENSTKSGYFDKLQVSQNGEMSSARLSIWASVKHKSGLQILSSLFVSALDQRQAHGTINSKSTFKPPPRVTLTDTKREAWLKDLGDPNMPLRRLSRTIPHGIRGKALLDHCLAKNIPTWRAVWLAKCVGANEIRAFKRKGTGGAFVSGGESKWIKDWTANVEQFVDALIAACGTTGWKGQMTYGLQLVAHIYSDYLVDQEHFLDWIITSTQEAENDTLPIWLLIVQMYWKDIPLYRRRGRRLAIALSEQLYRISSQGTVDANATLWRKISSLIRALMLSRPACFLFLDRWPRYAVPLNDCIASEDSATMACFEKISLRNRRFAEKVERDRAGNILTPRQQLILLLDGTKSTFNISHLSDTCLETVGDRELLVSTTIRWATTRFRSRVNGIYLSTRLLRRWNKSGVDLDSPLLNFLGICSSEIGLDSSKICKLVSELLRSRHFSIGRYLQWLVARGLTMGSVKQARLIELDLLKSVPLYDLPAYVINLRQIVLNSLGYSTTESSALFELLKEQVASNVSFIPQTQLPKCSSLDQDSFKILDNAHRLELSHWIRTNLVSWTSLQESKTLIASKESGSKALGILDYTYVTSLLIGFHDYAVLADILEIFIDFGGKELLEIISDTINTNFEILYALGAADSLFCSLIHRLEYLVSRSPTEKGLLASLVDLAERLPKRTRTTEQLRTELALCEPRSALAACSPVSDNMVEALQTSDSGFWEEVELLFSSGISMDKPLLLRMFIDITKRLETIWDDDEVVLGTYFDILARLRSFGPEVFDTIMLGWIGEALLSTSRPPLKRLLPSLICARAIKLQSILKQFVSHLETSRVIRTLLIVEVLDIFVAREVHASSQLLRDCALLCVSTQPLTSSQRDYRYLLEVEEILRNESGLISNLVRLLMEHSLLGDTDSKAVAEEFMASPGFSELLQCILIASPNDAENSFPILPPRRETLLILNRLLGNAGQSHLMNTRIDDHFVDLVEAVSPETIIKDILQIADDFNLSICKAKLRIFVGMAYQEESGLGLEPDKIAQILAQEAASSFTSNSSIWQGLLSALPLEIAAKFHASTISILFSAIPVLTLSPQIPVEQSLIDSGTIDRLIAAIKATERFLLPDVGSALFNQLAEKFSDVHHSLLHCRSENHNVNDTESSALSTLSPLIQESFKWIGVLAELIFIHQGAIQNPKFSQQTLSGLVSILSLLLVTPMLESHPSLTTTLFDVLVLLSDVLNPEARFHCKHFIRDRHHIFDRRLRFILGYLDQDEDFSLRLLVSDAKLQQPDQFALDASSLKSLSFSLRRWEMVQDATPIPGENDTSLSLGLFGARKAVI